MLRRIFIVAIVAIVAVLGLGLTGCVFREAPSSAVRSESRDVSGFDAVEFSGYGNLTLVQDDQYSVEIDASDNVRDRIRTEVRGDTLYIDRESRWFNWILPWSEPDIDIVVTAPEFTSLDVEGAGSVTIDDLEGDEFAFQLSGAGALYGRDITLDELTVDLSGAGSADLSGEVDAQDVTISGAASYDAGRLETKATSVEMSGAGSAVVWAERHLDVQVSGAGSVDYYGEAKVSQEISGAGSVSHRGKR